MILTDQGYVKVQKLETNDTLVGYDLQNQTRVNLSLVSIDESRQSYLVGINDGALLLTAIDQPIYAITSAGMGWVQDPVNLVVGDLVFDADQGQWIEVSSLTPMEKETTVYDLKTSGPNNFIANGLLLDQKQP